MGYPVLFGFAFPYPGLWAVEGWDGIVGWPWVLEGEGRGIILAGTKRARRRSDVDPLRRVSPCHFFQGMSGLCLACWAVEEWIGYGVSQSTEYNCLGRPVCGCSITLHVESSRGLSLGETVGPWHRLGSELAQQLVTSSSGGFQSARRLSRLGGCRSVTGLYNTEYST